MVPSDFRTTASNNGDDQYVYWAYGGFSMAIPYIAGLTALALQVNPDMTFEQIINTIIETKTVTSEGRYIINPKKFIDSI
ncbi:MAG: S8 family serine peptidase [Syntrophomonas sp.]|nr:S8 family serine peptidase [Syntrophomonas sp.]MDD4626903.1 S8 family serine peptidase [Syntrophomonas sp.]